MRSYAATLTDTLRLGSAAELADAAGSATSGVVSADPSGSLDLAGHQGLGPNQAKLFPVADGNDNGTFVLEVWAVEDCGDNAQLVSRLVTLSCILGTKTGVVLGATRRFADSITVAVGNDGIDVSVISPADNTPAHVVLDVKGSRRLKLTAHTFSGVTTANALVRKL